MDVEFREAAGDVPLERIYIAAVVLGNFHGRENVEVQLFRTGGGKGEIEELKGKNLVGAADPGMPPELLAGATEDAALGCLLEAFTLEEARELRDYLLSRYAGQIEKLVICPMNLPVPFGLGPLQALPEGEKSGFIHFDKAPDYKLSFNFKGYYDLAE